MRSPERRNGRSLLSMELERHKVIPVWFLNEKDPKKRRVQEIIHELINIAIAHLDSSITLADFKQRGADLVREASGYLPAPSEEPLLAFSLCGAENPAMVSAATRSAMRALLCAVENIGRNEYVGIVGLLTGEDGQGLAREVEGDFNAIHFFARPNWLGINPSATFLELRNLKGQVQETLIKTYQKRSVNTPKSSPILVSAKSFRRIFRELLKTLGIEIRNGDERFHIDPESFVPQYPDMPAFSLFLWWREQAIATLRTLTDDSDVVINRFLEFRKRFKPVPHPSH